MTNRDARLPLMLGAVLLGVFAHTLFTTADGIETLWEKSIPLLENPPPVRSYAPGSWGPNAIHQLIAPQAWRLPFERSWRESKDPYGS